MSITILGPQRFRTSVPAAVRELPVDGPIAAITAGWLERESNDTELGVALAGRMRNLRLFARHEQVLAAEPAFAQELADHTTMLAEQRATYNLRLQFAAEAAYTVWRRGEAGPIRSGAVRHAVKQIRALDEWHLQIVQDLRAEFAAAQRPHELPTVAAHRHEVADILRQSTALAITGGHVGVLLDCLEMFVDPEPPPIPVLAWSAGAMALATCVVLFDDDEVEGSGNSEVYRPGLGWYRGILPLPHARRRLHLSDPIRVAGLARRYAPLVPVILDDGVRVPLGPSGELPPGIPVLDRGGQIVESA